MAWKELDLGNKSAKELLALQKKVAAAQAKMTAKGKTALLKRWRSEAKKAGFTFEEVLEAASRRATSKSRRTKSKGKGAKVPMKYRNPKDATEAWSGRGRTPRWMQALLTKGKKKEDFLI